MSAIFSHGTGLFVTAKGPGKLHLLTYASNHSLENVVGYVGTPAGTSPRDTTCFIISHSYYYTRFAFYWEGTGEAVYGAGDSAIRYPMMKGWDKATILAWGSSSFTTGNVQAEVNTAVVRDQLITAFIVPKY